MLTFWLRIIAKVWEDIRANIACEAGGGRDDAVLKIQSDDLTICYLSIHFTSVLNMQKKWCLCACTATTEVGSACTTSCWRR